MGTDRAGGAGMALWELAVDLRAPPTRAQRLGVVRALGRVPHLGAFTVADGRLRLLVGGERAHAELIAARLGPALRHALGPLGCPALGLAAAPVALTAWTTSADPWREDTCLPDLAGLRLAAAGCAARLRTHGLRVDLAALAAAAGWPPLHAPLPPPEAVAALLPEALGAVWAALAPARCGPDPAAARAAALEVAVAAGLDAAAARAALRVPAAWVPGPACAATAAALRRQLVLRAGRPRPGGAAMAIRPRLDPRTGPGPSPSRPYSR